MKTIPSEVQSTSALTSTSLPLAVVASSNLISLKSDATTGDRGGVEGSDGIKNSTGPRVEPGADLREAKGEVNREAVCKTTSGGRADGRTTSGGKKNRTEPRVVGDYDLLNLMDDCVDDNNLNDDFNLLSLDYNNKSNDNLLSDYDPFSFTTTTIPSDYKDKSISDLWDLNVQSPPSVPLGVEPSSNYLPVNGNATPGDRGEESETIHGSRGEVIKRADGRTTSGGDGMKSSTGPQVEPENDLWEFEGELKGEGTTPSGKTSGINDSSHIDMINKNGIILLDILELVCKRILSNLNDNITSGKYLLTCLGKLIKHLPNEHLRIRKIIKRFKRHPNIELQQRSCELDIIIDLQPNLLKNLFDKIPHKKIILI